MHDTSSPRGDDAGIEQQILAAGKTAPRVTPADLEANIVAEYTFTADKAVGEGVPLMPSLSQLTFCVLVLRNGFTVTGESACASPENFDAAIGHRIARENAKQKVWALMGYELKQRLYERAVLPQGPDGFGNYRKRSVQPMRPYVPGEDMAGISVNKEDTPELGGMIAVNPKNPEDRWYVGRQFFEDNYEGA